MGRISKLEILKEITLFLFTKDTHIALMCSSLSYGKIRQKFNRKLLNCSLDTFWRVRLVKTIICVDLYHIVKGLLVAWPGMRGLGVQPPPEIKQVPIQIIFINVVKLKGIGSYFSAL